MFIAVARVKALLHCFLYLLAFDKFRSHSVTSSKRITTTKYQMVLGKYFSAILCETLAFYYAVVLVLNSDMAICPDEVNLIEGKKCFFILNVLSFGLTRHFEASSLYVGTLRTLLCRLSFPYCKYL